MNTHFNSKKQQSGLAAVVTAVVLLIVTTIIVIFSARFGLSEIKISANEARHKEAQQYADAALEQAASYIRRNPDLYEGSGAGWVACNTSVAIQNAFPCTLSIEGQNDLVFDSAYGTLVGNTIVPFPLNQDVAANGANSSPFILFDGSATGNVLTVVGFGTSNDGTARAGAKIDYAQVSLLTPGEIPPVMAPQLNLNGNFTIVGNPNNGIGTTGVPLSGWTQTNTSGTGTWQTCHLGDLQYNGNICIDTYTDSVADRAAWKQCTCTASLSNKDLVNYDILVEPAGEFPDPLEYVFGVSTIDELRTIIAAEGKYYPAGCAGLDTLNLTTLNRPWVFVDGDCTVPAIGTKVLPVILVVNGKMTVNANTDVWGLLFSNIELKTNGAAVVHGAMIARNLADITNGGYKQIYDPDVLERLADDTLNTSLSKVPYSWTDLINNLPNS